MVNTKIDTEDIIKILLTIGFISAFIFGIVNINIIENENPIFKNTSGITIILVLAIFVLITECIFYFMAKDDAVFDSFLENKIAAMVLSAFSIAFFALLGSLIKTIVVNFKTIMYHPGFIVAIGIIVFFVLNYIIYKKWLE
ncbi:MAG: hypothetical protein WC755_07000 [Candidatus Woesearchaeota archaeon]|jgi:hypothetical protein